MSSSSGLRRALRSLTSVASRVAEGARVGPHVPWTTIPRASFRPSSSSAAGGHAEASSDRVGAGLRGDGTAPRFYKRVEVVQMDDGSGDWGVALDGRRLKTPKRVPLAVPSKSLAVAVAAEWEWQSGRSVRPFTMPLMALVATAVDQMSQPEVRDLHVRKLLEHFHADVVLCRAEPGALAEHQAAAHEPILRWARAELGDVRPSDSIFGANISEEVMRAAEARLCSMDAFELTAAFNAAASAKSLLVGLALTRGAVDVETATRAARAEEDFQIAEWGLVEGGHDVDQADIAVRLSAPRTMLNLLRVG